MSSHWLVVMGVSGCGKSAFGQKLAADLGLPLIEGDEFHPAANVEKMRSGVPLDDQDRAGWLAILGERLAGHAEGAVLTCSALKRAYRDRLRAAVPSLRFVFLDISREEAARRVQTRGSHFFTGTRMVDNQFDTLEPPTGEPGVIALPAAAALAHNSAAVQAWLAADAQAA